ncbi:MAG: phosphatidate cytidylyltransferase [Acutalibacteraceae bacterium]
MKKRIISGVVMGAVVALVLALGLLLENFIITAFVAIIAGIGVLELVGNAAKIEWIVFKILSGVYTAIMVFILSSWLEEALRLSFFFNDDTASQIELTTSDVYLPVIAAIISIVYIIACAVLILIKQADFDLSKIAVLCGMPLLYAFAFSTISSIITATNGIYYLLLILNFSCVCDMGAYFVGVSYGKRKLCPEISPNKTVEGALGGIVSSIVVSLIITLCYAKFTAIIPTVLLTIPLCIAGMAGDLFASVIKRKTGIKDYGNLIPGHGGVLDRVDSMLFIAPLIFCLMFLGVL